MKVVSKGMLLVVIISVAGVALAGGFFAAVTGFRADHGPGNLILHKAPVSAPAHTVADAGFHALSQASTGTITEKPANCYLTGKAREMLFDYLSSIGKKLLTAV